MVNVINHLNIQPEESLVAKTSLAPSRLVEKISDIDPVTEAMHAKEKEPVHEDSKEKLEQGKRYDNPVERFFGDADYRNISIGSINATLHALATITSFGSHEGGLPWFQSINKLVDKAAFTCTRWIAPILSYGFAAYKAFQKKEGIKCFIKLLPPVFLPLVGDANIDTVYGSSTGINQPYDLAEERIKFLIEKHPELAASVKEANKTFSGNFKLTWGVLKQMCKEFAQGRMPKEESLFFANCIMILGGALPVMLFARHSRNTGFAKAMGLLRNLGGIIGDIGFFWFDRENMHKLSIATMCGVSACASIVKRWVKSDAVARTLIHLSAALDVSAYALWNAYNDKSQDKKGRTIKPEVVQSKLAQLADTKNVIIAATKSPFEKLPDARLASPETPELTESSMRMARDSRNAADGTLRMGSMAV